MSKYLKFLVDENTITQTHSDGIQNMYNSISSYNYSDIFDEQNDIIHSKKSRPLGKSYNDINVLYSPTTINHPMLLSRNTIITNNKTTITKTHIVRNTYPEEIKEAITLNLVTEMYFQDLVRNENIKQGNNTVIIPEILKYGIINYDNNDKIIFYTCPYYVDPNPPSFSHGLSNREQYVLDFQKLTKIFNTGFKEFESVMESLQLKHNDCSNLYSGYGEEYFQNILHILEENEPMKVARDYEKRFLYSTFSPSFYTFDINYFEQLASTDTFNYDNIKNATFSPTANIIKYNDKIVAIDYEHCCSTNSINRSLKRVCEALYKDKHNNN
jgi:hypothetical protein